jgi:hypothetical protein
MTFVNKQSLGVGSGDSLKYFHPSIFRKADLKNNIRPNTFNRVVDADLVLRSKDNKWYHSSSIAQSFNEHNEADRLSGSAVFQYSHPNLNVNLGTFFINENYNPEVGFVPGSFVYPGQMGYYSELEYKFYAKNSTILYTGPIAGISDTFLPDGTLVDRELAAGYTFNFQNSSEFEIEYANIFQRLTFDFNPINMDANKMYLEGEEFIWNTISASYRSNSNKNFSYLLGATYGGLYNGTNLNLTGQINLRFQPYVYVAMRFDYNSLELPDEYGKEELFLIGPKLDVTLTDKVFFTGYYQYNNLSDNMNLNARFQWRYKPASDMFIVYTENYFPNTFTSKNRAIVFKLTYWLNL